MVYQIGSGEQLGYSGVHNVMLSAVSKGVECPLPFPSIQYAAAFNLRLVCCTDCAAVQHIGNEHERNQISVVVYVDICGDA